MTLSLIDFAKVMSPWLSSQQATDAYAKIEAALAQQPPTESCENCQNGRDCSRWDCASVAALAQQAQPEDIVGESFRALHADLMVAKDRIAALEAQQAQPDSEAAHLRVLLANPILDDVSDDHVVRVKYGVLRALIRERPEVPTREQAEALPSTVPLYKHEDYVKRSDVLALFAPKETTP